MRIKMKTTMAGPEGVASADAVTDVDPRRADALIEGGYAEPVEPWVPKRRRRRKAKAPENATTTPPENAAGREAGPPEGGEPGPAA